MQPILCPNCHTVVEERIHFCASCGARLRDREASDAERDDAGLEARLREALAPTFLLMHSIGHGGMGLVYLAREPALRRLVAVKILAPALARDVEARARFEREAQAVASFSHPNVVGIHRVGELADGTPYFVMQFVDGPSLSSRVKEDGPLAPLDARRVLGEVAAALAAAHAKGIIHRDVKPANVLLDRESGRALVSDFGISVAAKRKATDPRLTGTGVLVGTPQYMSPEQLGVEPVTEKSDVYGLGLLGYEMLTGRGPFRGDSPHELVAAHLRDTPPKLSSVLPDLDPELDELIASCLEKDPARRPAAADLARRLEVQAASLVEWPPPGLESLHGRLRVHARRMLVRQMALVGAFLVYLVGGSEVPWIGASAGALLLGVLVASASLGLLVATVSLVVDAFRARARVESGYAWFTVAEVAADERRDTGRLISATREYATIPVAARNALRRGRVTRALLELAAAYALALGMLLLGWVGAAGWFPAVASTLVVLAPAVACIALAIAFDAREALQLRSARMRLEAPRRARDIPGLIESWHRSFDSARSGQSLGRGSRGGVRLAAVGALALGLATWALVATLLPMWTIATIGPGMFDLRMPSARRSSDRARLAATVLPFATPIDPAVTPTEAGEAYWRIETTLRRVPATAHMPEHPAAPLNPLPVLERVDTLFVGERAEGWLGPDELKLLERARRGFSPAESAWLRELSRHPVWADFAIIARAPALDAIGGRYRLPFPAEALDSDRRIVSFGATRALAYANGARAALLLSEGRSVEAEAVIRQTIGYGRALMDATTPIESLIGTVVVRTGRDHLLALYEATGRPEAMRIRATYDSVTARLAAEDSAVIGRLDMQRGADRARFTAAIRDSTLSRAMRFELLHVLSLAPCTNVREAIFGMSPATDAEFQWAAEHLAIHESERALIQMMRELVERSAARVPSNLDSKPPGFAVVSRLSGFWRNPRLVGCTRLIMTGDLWRD